VPPVSIMIKPVSGLCNMRCRYCFYADEMKNRGEASFGRMTEETLEKLIRRVFAYAEGQVHMAFQGGEPTLAGAAFYRKVLALERKYNASRIPVVHTMQTNGLDIDDDMIAVLKEGSFLVGLSLDGTESIHDSRRTDTAGQGTYARVMRTAEKLRAAGVEYNVLCVVDEMTALHADEVYEALNGFIYMQFIPCMDPLTDDKRQGALTAESYGVFMDAVYRRYAADLRSGKPVSVRAFDNWLAMLAGYPPESCGVSGRCSPNYLIESNGNVYPCDFYALDEYLMGNINHCSFYTLEKSVVQKRFLSRSVRVSDACRACPYFGICRGGCCRDRDEKGEIGLNRLCTAYKYFFERDLEDMKALSAFMFGRKNG